MSADPATRARTRLYLYRFENELLCHIDTIEHGQQKVADQARQLIRDNLIQVSELIGKRNYLQGNELSMYSQTCFRINV